MVHHRSSTSARISEETLGSVREPLTDSHRCGQPTSSSGKTDLRSRTRPTAAAVEQLRPQVTAQYTMAEAADIHPTAGRRRKEKGPPSSLALPRLERVSDTECGHSDDSAGEKEAKRQRFNIGTPVSTPRRMPYDYDAVMGITRVGTREAEGFDEDLGSMEYQDAKETTDEPSRKDETECTSPQQKSTGFQGGYGSSSLKECIELLNTTIRIAPAPLDSGVGKKSPDPLQVMSPNMEGSLTDATAQPSSGSNSQVTVPVTKPRDGSDSQKVSQVKDEPPSQVKDESVKEIKPESSSSTQEVKVEQEESEKQGESIASVKQEEHAAEPDSEDSFTPERAVEAIQRLLEAQESRTGEREHFEEEREVGSPYANPRERVSGSETSRGTRVRSLRTARGKKSEKKMRLAGSILV